MEELKAKWNGLTLIGKIGVVLGFPLILALIIFSGEGAISGWLDDKQRKKVDDASADLDKKKAQTDQDISREEGKVEQLKEDEKKAVQDAGNQDAADFINNRFKPPGK